jgi:hypothetical protein
MLVQHLNVHGSVPGDAGFELSDLGRDSEHLLGPLLDPWIIVS